MDETGVLGLLEELSILLEDSKPVFGKGNMRQVDIAAAFEIMDEIRDTFPSEFAQARQIVRERQSLLDDAEAEANRMIEDARSQAMTIASEQEIVRISQQQADQVLSDARELERQTRAGAEDYADEVFGHVEQSLDTLLNNVRRCRDRLNANSLASPSTVPVTRSASPVLEMSACQASGPAKSYRSGPAFITGMAIEPSK